MGSCVLGCPPVVHGAAGQGGAEGATDGPPDGATGPPAPLLPDWEGACLHRVVPALLSQVAAGTDDVVVPWLPEPVAGAGQIVLLVLDGLGAEQLEARRTLAPFLSTGTGGTVTSVAPSTTACALTSLVTGRTPAEHGVVGLPARATTARS